MPTEAIFLVGAGGHAWVVYDALLSGAAGPAGVRIFDEDPARIGTAVLGLTVAALPLLLLALLAWTLTLLGLGAMLGVLARSLAELSAAYDIGAMLLSSLGGALVPLAVLPGWVRQVAPASPGYWAVSALDAAFRGDAGRTLAASAVLAAFAVAAGLVTTLRASRGWGRSARL